MKFNVKTGETRILMSKDTNGIMPTFRSAIKLNNKLYFVGMIIDANSKQLTSQELRMQQLCKTVSHVFTK